ncbi:MAG: hypothetical protein KBD00_04840 [Candidatus Peribacteraceae bacterium]|nr:hypothetical protein [Candidatus Peribacteraceae bacterium]
MISTLNVCIAAFRAESGVGADLVVADIASDELGHCASPRSCKELDIDLS